jgi:hypothetical protein
MIYIIEEAHGTVRDVVDTGDSYHLLEDFYPEMEEKLVKFSTGRKDTGYLAVELRMPPLAEGLQIQYHLKAAVMVLMRGYQGVVDRVEPYEWKC